MLQVSAKPENPEPDMLYSQLSPCNAASPSVITRSRIIGTDKVLKCVHKLTGSSWVVYVRDAEGGTQ